MQDISHSCRIPLTKRCTLNSLEAGKRLNVFNKYKAYDAKSAIDIDNDDFKWLFTDDYTVKDTFNSLKRKGFIKKEDNKYYIDKESEEE